MIRKAAQFAVATIIVSSGYVLAQSLSVRLNASPVSGNEIVLTLDAACPTGSTEVAALDASFLQGTLAAHSDVGGTGGTNAVTPTGANSAPSFTGSALGTHSHTAGTFSAAAQTFTGSSGTVSAQTISWPVGVPTFAGSALGTHTHTTTATGTNSAPAFTGTPFSGVINHTHTVNITDPGHTHVEQYNSATTGPNTGWTTVDTSSNTPTAVTTTTASATTGITAASVNPAGGVASITPAGTVAAPTFTGDSITSSAVSGGTPAGTVAWPAGVPTNGTVSFTPSGTNGTSSVSGTSQAVSAGTPAGTVAAPIFTGDSQDNRPAYTKVIFCQRAVTAPPLTDPLAGGMLVGSVWGFAVLRRRPNMT